MYGSCPSTSTNTSGPRPCSTRSPGATVSRSSAAADGLTVLHCGGELPYVIDTAAESADRRAQLLRADGLERAVVALSSPIGIEALPHDVAAELISAHLDGVLALGDRFAAWGPIPVDDPDPADVDDVLRRGCVGVSVPACALAGREALDAAGPGARARAGSRRPAVRAPRRRRRRAKRARRRSPSRCGGAP